MLCERSVPVSSHMIQNLVIIYDHCDFTAVMRISQSRNSSLALFRPEFSHLAKAQTEINNIISCHIFFFRMIASYTLCFAALHTAVAKALLLSWLPFWLKGGGSLFFPHFSMMKMRPRATGGKEEG